MRRGATCPSVTRTDDALRRGSHTSVVELQNAIAAYVEAHNEEAKPFRWTKSADEILAKVRRFGERTLAAHREEG